jgi:hypothetical protein
MDEVQTLRAFRDVDERDIEAAEARARVRLRAHMAPTEQVPSAGRAAQPELVLSAAPQSPAVRRRIGYWVATAAACIAVAAIGLSFARSNGPTEVSVADPDPAATVATTEPTPGSDTPLSATYLPDGFVADAELTTETGEGAEVVRLGAVRTDEVTGAVTGSIVVALVTEPGASASAERLVRDHSGRTTTVRGLPGFVFVDPGDNVVVGWSDGPERLITVSTTGLPESEAAAIAEGIAVSS